jgi:predicted transcriptional regulator
MSDTVSAQAELVTFKLPAAEKADLERLALSQERTVSAVLRLLVREFIAREST